MVQRKLGKNKMNNIFERISMQTTDHKMQHAKKAYFKLWDCCTLLNSTAVPC